jgi:hypothetical protein
VTVGYTSAPWTLKADLTSQYVCRLLQHMAARGASRCTPRFPPPDEPVHAFTDFSSGYFERSMHLLPQQGSRRPWKLNTGYLADLWQLGHAAVDDGVLAFDEAVPWRRVPAAAQPDAAAAQRHATS